MEHQCLIIVDLGGQSSQMVARCVRENSVYCEVVPYTKAVDAIKRTRPCGVVFAGGCDDMPEENVPDINKAVYDMDVPILGMGCGAHIIARDFGKIPVQQEYVHDGWDEKEILGGLIEKIAIGDKERKIYAVELHIEE